MDLDKSFKLTFSGHETFPLKYGWLKKVYDIVKKSEDIDARKVFSSDQAIANFGVGKNMVASIRHWAQHTNILKYNSETKFLELSPFAHLYLSEVDGLDPWLEHANTIWLLHWNLAQNKSLFTYYWVFNSLNRNEFTREQIADSIVEFLSKHDHEMPSSLTLKRDIECLLRNYSHKSHSKNVSFSEDDIESPLAELNLIKRLPHDKFLIQRGIKQNLSTEIFLYCLVEFWSKQHKTNTTLSLESVTYDPESPGRIFFLDEEAVIGYAFDTEKMQGIGIHWSETAGLRQFVIYDSIDKIIENTRKALAASYEE